MQVAILSKETAANPLSFSLRGCQARSSSAFFSMEHRTCMLMSSFCFSLLYSIFFLSLTLHIKFSAAAEIQTNTTETDRLALLAIKAKLVDGPTHVLSSWNDSLSFCDWQGVTCSARRQRVVVLDLRSQGLMGTLSPYIGNLTFLTRLSLLNNSFGGEIPSEIGHLRRLQELELYNNSFVGEIPVNISRCTNLQKLLFGNNKLVGKIPSELGYLSKLVQLVLQKNNLTGEIPASIGNLSSLQTLGFTYNALKGSIPDSLGQLKSITVLSLGVNMLSGMVPSSLYNISSVKSLVFTLNNLNGTFPLKINLPNLQNYLVGGNRFSGTVPVSLFNSSSFQLLDMGQNKFSGRFPIEVGNQKKLERLTIGNNSFGSGKTGDLDFLVSLINCTLLFVLDINRNYFGGMLPNSIGNLSEQLSFFYMGNNQIHGTIPSQILEYPNLLELGMNDNFFNGSVPFSIGMLKRLQVLLLQGNKLSGYFPSSIGNMSNLFETDLSTNNFEGEILSDITKCPSLGMVNLENNKFNGTIPEDIADLSSTLLILKLAHNSFSGSLPLQLGSFKNLQILNVSENKMSGEIPSDIGRCLSLESLSLKGNFFQGSIPPSMKSLKEMLTMDLSMNNFSGEIPQYLGDLPLLIHLNLSFNHFEGRIPAEGVFKNTSAFSILGNGKVCGGMSELQLPACHIQKSTKGKMSSSLKVLFGVVGSSILLTIIAIFAIYWKMRLKGKPSLAPVPETRFERFSYQELHKATDGFSIANLIGMGSLGSVYKGNLQENGPVAIKVLNLLEREASKSFINECDALRRIRHRNVLKILTICSSVDFKGNDFKALILKFMPNGSLENFLHPSSNGQYQNRVLSLFERLNIAIGIASALNYLHNQCETPIVHCDLKPSNILLDDDMEAHVGDFGIAKFLPRNTDNFSISESSSNSPRGTIGYIPPEYGSGAEVSTQGDVYSFGILLLEMITAKRPTTDIFKDGLTLHKFSSNGLALRVIDIVDPQIFLEEENDEEIIQLSYQREKEKRLQECTASIVKIGIACSVESQTERIGINEALLELQVVKKDFLGARN